jgi:hypothetical protein
MYHAYAFCGYTFLTATLNFEQVSVSQAKAIRHGNYSKNRGKKMKIMHLNSLEKIVNRP